MNLPELTYRVIAYNRGDPARIQHLLKVHAIARLVGLSEKIDMLTLEVLEAAALLHDVGIHICEKKYGNCAGSLQEREGPPIAREILGDMDIPVATCDRICFLVGHHHTYVPIDGLDHQILIEADLIVNFYENGFTRDAILSTYRKIFQTETGKRLCQDMFAI